MTIEERSGTDVMLTKERQDITESILSGHVTEVLYSSSNKTPDGEKSRRQSHCSHAVACCMLRQRCHPR